jgi:mannose/fructose/N-acetylgalactosamine-specific phosphotransferase system component IIC
MNTDITHGHPRFENNAKKCRCKKINMVHIFLFNAGMNADMTHGHPRFDNNTKKCKYKKINMVQFIFLMQEFTQIWPAVILVLTTMQKNVNIVATQVANHLGSKHFR